MVKSCKHGEYGPFERVLVFGFFFFFPVLVF